MKLLLIGNCIYLPIDGTNKYISGTISGTMFLTDIYTKEEIYHKHSDNKATITEHNNLHELTKAWGNR